jgi:hypothetical protein
MSNGDGRGGVRHSARVRAGAQRLPAADPTPGVTCTSGAICTERIRERVEHCSITPCLRACGCRPPLASHAVRCRTCWVAPRSDRRLAIAAVRAGSDPITRADGVLRNPRIGLGWTNGTLHRRERRRRCRRGPAEMPVFMGDSRRSRRGDSNPRPHHYERSRRRSQAQWAHATGSSGGCARSVALGGTLRATPNGRHIGLVEVGGVSGAASEQIVALCLGHVRPLHLRGRPARRLH